MSGGVGQRPQPGLRILYIGTLPPHPGGTGVLAGMMLPGLARLGHRITAIAPVVEADAARAAAFAAANPAIRIVRFPVRHNLTTPDFLHPAFGQALERERSEVRRCVSACSGTEEWDVVLLGRETYLWCFEDAAADLPAPVVSIVHSLITYRCMSGFYPERMVKEAVTRYRSAARLITPGEHVAQWLSSMGLERVSVIPNPVDLSAFSPRPRDPLLLARLSIRQEDTVVMHASNLKAVKRPLDVVASAAKALRRNPRLMYVVVGDGEYRESLLAACREADIEDRFRFAGWVEHEEMPAWLSIADIVTVPSEAETQALICLEAQACGRVVIASDIPSARQVVRDGVSGFLHKLGDTEHLASLTLAAAADARLRNEIGGNARRLAACHSLDIVAAAYDTVLREAAGTRP